MKLSFQFENGSSLIILTPENPRDKTYIDLCVDGKNDIRIKPTTTDGLALEFRASEQTKLPFNYSIKQTDNNIDPYDCIGKESELICDSKPEIAHTSKG